MENENDDGRPKLRAIALSPESQRRFGNRRRKIGNRKGRKVFRKARKEVIILCALCASFAALREGNIRGKKKMSIEHSAQTNQFYVHLSLNS